MIRYVRLSMDRRMRGRDRQNGQLFSYISPEALVPPDHPLRAIKQLLDRALERLSADFAAIYSAIGRPSIPPERLLRALLLQALFSVRSERQLMQQITYNMLFRWFIGMSMDAPVWDVTVFTKNRDRLLEGDIAIGLLTAVLADPQVKPLLSSEHFTVDGTLIEAWASMKSLRAKDGSDEPPEPGRNGDRNFRGERRSNETHASTTDPDARLFRKSAGQPSQLCHMGHLLMENRNGLLVDARLTPATGTAEREAAVAMLGECPSGSRITVGADKLFDTSGFVADMRRLRVTPHVAQHTNGRRSAIDRRTTRHTGYDLSQRIRKRIEEGFGWIKTIGGLRKTRHRGTRRVGWQFVLTVVAYNLVRIPKLLAP